MKNSIRMKSFPISSKLFLYSGIFLIVFSFINLFFLDNQDFKENVKALEYSFRSSDLFLAIGIGFLLMGFIYLSSRREVGFVLSEKSARIHYFLTIPFIIVLMAAPVGETIYNNDVPLEQYPALFEQIVNLGIIATFLLFLAQVILVVNLIRGTYFWLYFILKR